MNSIPESQCNSWSNLLPVEGSRPGSCITAVKGPKSMRPSDRRDPKRSRILRQNKPKKSIEKLDLELKHRHENQVGSQMRCLSIPSRYCTITPRISDKPNSIIINQMAFVFSSICSNTSLYPLVIYRSGKSLYFPFANHLSMGHVHPFSISNYSSLDLREYPLLNIAMGNNYVCR